MVADRLRGNRHSLRFVKPKSYTTWETTMRKRIQKELNVVTFTTIDYYVNTELETCFEITPELLDYLCSLAGYSHRGELSVLKLTAV